MKIGKYPVKHTYKVARIISDVLSLGLVVLIVSATFAFLESYKHFYSLIDINNEAALEALRQNNPDYEWQQWLSLIFPVLAVAVLAVYIVLVLKSHKLSRYDVNKRNAQKCYDAYAFGASLCKIPALLIVFDIMCIVQDKLLMSAYGFSWFSWLTLLSVLMIAIIVRYTMHRLAHITAKPAAVSSDAVKVKAVAVSSKPEDSDKKEDNKEEI